MKAAIAIVDDDADFLRSLQVLLQAADYHVRSFARAEEFLAGTDRRDVSCVILDERMAGLSGLDAHRELRRLGHATPVVMLTGHATVPLAIQAFEQGVTYFLEKPVARAQLLDRVERCVASHEARQSTEACRKELLARLDLLSEREKQVVSMLAEGQLNKQIAATLRVSLRTIETYRKRVVRKLGVASNAEIVKFALISGLLEPPVGRPPAGER